MTEYTPGPWGFDDAGGEAPFGVFGEDGDAVCYLTENAMGSAGLREYAEDHANARLIAAVPGLYEAAKAIEHEIDICEAESISSSRVVGVYLLREQVAALRAAIAAAEGVES